MKKSAKSRGADGIDQINSVFQETMITAYSETRETWKSNPQIANLRTSVFLSAINKIAVAYKRAGNFPVTGATAKRFVC